MLGQVNGPLSRTAGGGVGFLDDEDRDLIALRRTDTHGLGMAVQICMVRHIGPFLGDDPLVVSWEVGE
ncbi:DUF4158 domain-containing protein [Streptomyces sp. 2132.2]|uniref:DUF4158 domain-containing protein n=1 Tax=Streptomyces sp. 2132.2 TaxID=2485161 RepID=UPI000F4910DF|nr:DUF4158 domain-containing protein [Streptomyces sp. 2132.2]